MLASEAEFIIFTWLQLKEYFLVGAVQSGATNRARLDVCPVDRLRRWVVVDGDRVLRLTGGRQLEYRRAVEGHLEQLALGTVHEQQKVVVHDCTDVSDTSVNTYIANELQSSSIKIVLAMRHTNHKIKIKMTNKTKRPCTVSPV